MSEHAELGAWGKGCVGPILERSAEDSARAVNDMRRIALERQSVAKTAKEAVAQMYEAQRAAEPGNGKLEIGEVWNDGVDAPAPVAPPLTQTQRKIVATCDSVKNLLLEKNRAYGNSALDPVRVFSKASVEEQLLVRIDDKLSRLSRGTNTEAVPEDTVRDLIGYLVLLLVARGRSGQ